jgi:hypothetical protein
MLKALALVALCSQVAVADPKPGSCEAVAKQHAKSTKLAAFKPPANCTPKGGDRAPYLVKTEDDARPNLECKDPKAKLGVDFTKQHLVVTSRSMSPAQVGMDVYDDGKVVTFVSRDRSPCKGDPQPMPGPNTTFIYQLKAGARTFAEASCTVETKCSK